jgi:hypothetical protein
MARRFATVITSAFLVGFAVSMVWGDGGDTTKIHACVAKDGVVRIVGPLASCKSSETPLHWNIVGPAGPEGPQGPAGTDGVGGVDGVDGETGPRGPSDAYVTVNDIPQSFDISTNPETVVALLNLDAGNYVLNAKVVVGNVSGVENEDIACALRQGPFASILLDFTSVRPNPGAPFAAGSIETLALAGSASLSASDTIRVICTASIEAPGSAFAHSARLNAIKVETLTTQ